MKTIFYFLVIGTRYYILPRTTGCALIILHPRSEIQNPSHALGANTVVTSTASELPRSYFKVLCHSGTHGLSSHMTSDMKQVLQQEILRHVLPKLNIQHSSLK